MCLETLCLVLIRAAEDACTCPQMNSFKEKTWCWKGKKKLIRFLLPSVFKYLSHIWELTSFWCGLVAATPNPQILFYFFNFTPGASPLVSLILSAAAAALFWTYLLPSFWRAAEVLNGSGLIPNVSSVKDRCRESVREQPLWFNFKNISCSRLFLTFQH